MCVKKPSWVTSSNNSDRDVRKVDSELSVPELAGMDEMALMSFMIPQELF